MTIQAKLNKEVQAKDAFSSFGFVETSFWMLLPFSDSPKGSSSPKVGDVRSLLGQEISSLRSLPRDESLLPRSLPSLGISDLSRSLISLPRKFQSSIPNNQINNNNTSSSTHSSFDFSNHFSSCTSTFSNHFSSCTSSNPLTNSFTSNPSTRNNVDDDVADTDHSDDSDSLNRSHCVDSCDGSDRDCDDCALYGDRSDTDSAFGDPCSVSGGNDLCDDVWISSAGVFCVENHRIPLW